MFTREFPKEAMHLSETRTILESCLYELGIEQKDLITKFIYDKKDKECENSYLSLLINSVQEGKPMISESTATEPARQYKISRMPQDALLCIIYIMWTDKQI